MSEPRFDVFTRQVAEAMSRRRSLLALGGAGAAVAALASPAITTAKKGRKRRKRKKKDPFKKCQRQIDECQEFYEDVVCEQVNCSPEELEDLLDCCELLGECDFTEWAECVEEAFD